MAVCSALRSWPRASSPCINSPTSASTSPPSGRTDAPHRRCVPAGLDHLGSAPAQTLHLPTCRRPPEDRWPPRRQGLARRSVDRRLHRHTGRRSPAPALPRTRTPPAAKTASATARRSSKRVGLSFSTSARLPLIHSSDKEMLMRTGFLLPALLLTHAAFAQVDEKLLGGMQYRLAGPFRGGRVIAVAGVAGDPQTYYFGAAAGGVWKSVDGGAHWNPMFDKEAIASIGSIAVAPSDANVVYVGSGEGCLRGNISYGDGVYRSNDAGKTWKNLGLRDTRHIPRLLVDPRNPEVVLVAAQGHAFGPNAERGVFRTTDGGRNWTKV